MAGSDTETLEIDTQDTEITLGTGKLLGIFFAVAILCGLFFTMGYMLGHSSAPSGRTEIVSNVPNGGSSTGKPGAGNKSADITQNCVPGSPNCAQTTGTDSPAASSGKNPDTQNTSSGSQPASGDSGASSPNSGDGKSNSAGSFIVQVAAVSKQEDAETLVSVLRKKQYPVFIAANNNSDSLFHVQVGPFSDRKDADTMRTRLSNDGYNAIVKP